MTVCGHAPYDHIWMSCCYLHQRKSPVPQTGTTNPESVPNDSRSFSIRTLMRELVPNQSRTSRHWFRTNPEQLQDRSRSGLSRRRSGRHHSESDSSGAVSSNTGLLRRLAAAVAARRCSSSMCAFLWREKLDECMKVLLQAAQV